MHPFMHRDESLPAVPPYLLQKAASLKVMSLRNAFLNFCNPAHTIPGLANTEGFKYSFPSLQHM